MASTTATALDAPARTQPWRQWRRAGAALASAGRQAATMAGAARRRYRRPALAVSSFSCAVASAWHTFGIGAGLLAASAAFAALELLSGDEDEQ